MDPGARRQTGDLRRFGHRVATAQVTRLAGQQQMGGAARCGAGLHMAQRVAGDGHVAGRHAEPIRHLLEQAGFRLAAVTGIFGGVRAEKDRLDPPAHRGQRAVHLGVDGVERGHVEQAAADAGLVGGQHHTPATVVEPCHRLQRTRQSLPLIGRGHVVVAAAVERAVAVEDQQFHAVLQTVGRRAGPPQARPRPFGGQRPAKRRSVGAVVMRPTGRDRRRGSWLRAATSAAPGGWP
jgi:hypothetical protein